MEFAYPKQTRFRTSRSNFFKASPGTAKLIHLHVRQPRWITEVIKEWTNTDPEIVRYGQHVCFRPRKAWKLHISITYGRNICTCSFILLDHPIQQIWQILDRFVEGILVGHCWDWLKLFKKTCKSKMRVVQACKSGGLSVCLNRRGSERICFGCL